MASATIIVPVAHIPMDQATVYFMPTQEFTASTDGIEPVRYVPGKDANGDPLIYSVPRHQAVDWEKRYGWGRIVEVRRTVKGAPATSESPSTPPDQTAEVISAPGMTDPALKTATQIASLVTQSTPAQAGASAANAPNPSRDASADQQVTGAGKGKADTKSGKSEPAKSNPKGAKK